MKITNRKLHLFLPALALVAFTAGARAGSKPLNVSAFAASQAAVHKSASSWTSANSSTAPTLITQEILATDSTNGDKLGSAIAVYGSIAFIGAPGASANGNSGAGAVYVFTKSNGTWAETQKLIASDGATGDGFGLAIAYDGNALLISSPTAAVSGNYQQGAVYVFTQTGGTWSQAQKLTASDGAANDQFGSSLSISGTTAVVGAARATVGGNFAQGAAYVFSNSSGGWNQAQKLIAGDGAQLDGFGTSVALQGTTLMVSSVNAFVNGTSGQGAVYVYADSGSGWSQTQKLSANDTAASAYFGTAIALDSGTALIGAIQATVNGLYTGAVYVFSNAGGTWSQTQKLSAPDGARGDDFGNAIAFTDGVAAIGAYEASVGSNAEQGTAYLFVDSGGTWSFSRKLVAEDGATNDFYGTAVAAGGHSILVGTQKDNTVPGVAYTYGASALSLALSAPTTTPPGSTFTSQAIATNASTYASPAVTVTVSVPAGANLVSVNASQGSCSEASGMVTCNFGQIASNGGTATANVLLKTTGSTGDTVNLTASVAKSVPALHASGSTILDTPPTANDGTLDATAGRAATGTLNADDPSGGTLTYAIVSQSSHGTLSLDANTGAYTYTANGSYTGTDSFTWKVNDGIADSNTATVDVSVRAAPKPPNGGGGGGGFSSFVLALLAALYACIPVAGRRRKS